MTEIDITIPYIIFYLPIIITIISCYITGIINNTIFGSIHVLVIIVCSLLTNYILYVV